MKSKKILAAIALTLGSTLLASCTGCMGCAGETLLTFRPYWRQNVEAPSNQKEVLTYSVTHKGTNEYNGYTVAYTNGSYVTEFEGDRGLDEDVYVLRTAFSINVEYTFNGQSSGVFQDLVQTEVRFKSTRYGLEPIYSTKNVVSHSPASGDVTQPADCFVVYRQAVTLDYENNLATIVDDYNTDNPVTNSFNFDAEYDEDYVAIDNEQMLFALRCIDATATASFQTYSPVAGTTRNYVAKFSNSSKKTFENLTINGVTGSPEIDYHTVSLQLDEPASGTTKTVYIAAKTDALNNAYRNVVLGYENPLNYSLGKLVYTLTDANFNANA